MDYNQIAQQYLTDPGTRLTLDQRLDFQLWVNEEFQRVLDLGHDFRFVNYDPYASAADMLADRVATGGILKISMLYNDSFLLPGVSNLMFRAVHDTDHCDLGHTDFTLGAEVEAYERIAGRTDNKLFKQILFSEIVAQAAAYFYLGGRFPEGEQKVVLF